MRRFPIVNYVSLLLFSIGVGNLCACGQKGDTNEFSRLPGVCGQIKSWSYGGGFQLTAQYATPEWEWKKLAEAPIDEAGKFCIALPDESAFPSDFRPHPIDDGWVPAGCTSTVKVEPEGAEKFLVAFEATSPDYSGTPLYVREYTKRELNPQDYLYIKSEWTYSSQEIVMTGEIYCGDRSPPRTEISDIHLQPGWSRLVFETSIRPTGDTFSVSTKELPEDVGWIIHNG